MTSSEELRKKSIEELTEMVSAKAKAGVTVHWSEVLAMVEDFIYDGMLSLLNMVLLNGNHVVKLQNAINAGFGGENRIEELDVAKAMEEFQMSLTKERLIRQYQLYESKQQAASGIIVASPV